MVEHGVHVGLRLADGKTAYGVAVPLAHAQDLARGLAAKRRVDPALQDGEERLRGTLEVIAFRALLEGTPRPREPAETPLARIARPSFLGLPRYDMIERHDHVGAERALYADHAFGSEEAERPVDVAPELHALLRHFAQRLE